RQLRPPEPKPCTAGSPAIRLLPASRAAPARRVARSCCTTVALMCRAASCSARAGACSPMRNCCRNCVNATAGTTWRCITAEPAVPYRQDWTDSMNPDYLDFEQPIAELEAKINELRLVGSDNRLNITEEISRLQDKSLKLTEKIFSALTPWQISMLARHPLRPYTEDYIRYMFADFDELHGDRYFADDAALIG